MPKLSVLVPVYNVEAWIDKCARSLFEQTIDDVEYIFVDDCTSDRSIEILTATLAEYPRRIPQVKIIHHDKNRGLVASRNTALRVATGDFIIHCDSDDWVDCQAYEEMYKQAVVSNADMVYCSFVMEYAGGQQRIVPFVAINSGQDYLNLMMDWTDIPLSSLWSKMYRREIAADRSIVCPDHLCMNEDLLRNALTLRLCRKVFGINRPYYHYNRMSASMCAAKDMDTIRKQHRCSRDVVDYIELHVRAINETVLSRRKAFVLFLYLSSNMGADEYKGLYPDIQKKLLCLKIKKHHKILLFIARISYSGARVLFVFWNKIMGALK